ncbi:MAG: hypothetical protein IT378_26040 [Sandaracinaceae bacterium]|nr:hypothetical protein [Sandaracinaceae bacterium]
MTRLSLLVVLFVGALFAGAGCCGGGGSCAERQACCDAIEGAESSSTVAYIRGACRVQMNSASLCSRSMDNIHDRIARTPADNVPQACRP